MVIATRIVIGTLIELAIKTIIVTVSLSQFDSILLQVLVSPLIVLHRLPDRIGSFLAVLLDPFRIKLIVTLRSFLLHWSLARSFSMKARLVGDSHALSASDLSIR